MASKETFSLKYNSFCAGTEIKGTRPDSAYCSTAGGFGQKVIAALLALALQWGARIIAAFDSDSAGERYAGMLEDGCKQGGIPFTRHCPPEPAKDWNEALTSIAPMQKVDAFSSVDLASEMTEENGAVSD